METRRAVLGTIAGAGIASLAGCALLQDTIEESAQPAGVGDDALASTGFEHRTTNEQVVERTVEAGGESRDIKLTNYVVQYGKAVESVGQDAATFQLFTTPGVTIAGNDVNPYKALGDDQLLRTVIEQSSQGEAENVEQTGTETVTVLGEAVSFSQYEATTQVEGQDVAAMLHFGRTTNEGDLLVVSGGYPEMIDEWPNIVTLAEGTVHPHETDDSGGGGY